MGRVSQIMIYEKVREVYTFMINASKQRKDIIQFFSEKWADDFKTTDIKSIHRTIDNYIHKVRKTFLNFEADYEIEKGRHLSRLDDLYSKNIKIQDYKSALMVAREIAETIGFKAPLKTEHLGEIKTNTRIVFKKFENEQ